MRVNEEKISQLLDKTTDFDKDERYMATSDLCVELNKDAELGAYLEPKVCAAVLKQLDDKSNDVQSIAVKCLGILVTKVQVAQVADICAKLCDLILNGKPELRDIYSIGLKTIVADDKDAAVKAETLDILTDLLRRFGYDVATEHATIMELLMVQLTDESPLVRKRATACVGSLGVMASDVLVSRLVEHLIKGIQGSSDSANHLDAVIRILVQFCGDPEDESLQNEDSDELRGNCFQAFEAFVIRCHNEITPHVEAILKLVMQFISYDPNYNYVDSADEDEDMEEEEESTVMKKETTVMTTTRAGRPELLEQLYIHCAQTLISRFKEREENVRIDVFAELLRATLPSRCAVVAMLSELAMVEHGKLGDFIGRLMPNILNAVEDKHSDLKLDALLFLRLLIDTHTVEPFRLHVESIVVAVQCAKEIVLPSLKVHDIDQEIKEAAISSIGEIIAVLGDELGPRVGEVYPLLMERLNNEITRTLAQLLRQQSRTLKQATLATLNDLVVHKGANMPETLHCEVVLEASLLLVDVDLQLCRMSITLVSNSLRVCPHVASTDALLQNAPSEGSRIVSQLHASGPHAGFPEGSFRATDAVEFSGSSFPDLFKALMATPSEESKHSVLNIARWSVVDLGPFKHKVDDGLPLRKAAYSCVDTLIQVLPQQLDISLFFDQLKRGLGDQDDIQMLSHQILIKICYVQPGSIVGALDSLIDPLEKTINKKVKEDQVGPEVERVKDLIRSALRTLDAISAVRDVDSHPRLNNVMENAKKNKMLGPLLETIRSERSSN
ncbi:Cullin-associated NEDD8-dissociated protein 1 [Phytophthora cinnamomi]|uniref:Cullin-associated NEDD8-dissociated protein 1 n=1 Tax=Phytophthora cinnamomi TaxID=4785 RepID=UPI00355A33A4|nr:Cullin-associated NEDD8-dissociated protein 1 [Phytophthora cinnamomi]